MLEYAFERLGVRRVEFKTEATNARSRAALAALPAQFEGMHRNHMLVRGGESTATRPGTASSTRSGRRCAEQLRVAGLGRLGA